VQIEFYFDPLCPWAWMTANWIKSIEKDRNLDINWKSISLKQKNGEMPEPWATKANNTLKMLRLVEAVKRDGDEDKVQPFYFSIGKAIHKDGLLKEDNPDIRGKTIEALNLAGLDQKYAEYLEDESLDAAVQKSTDEAIELAGEDVGTPIISLLDNTGKKIALFGPVISELPKERQDVLELWDAYVVFATKPYFWELKRTRTVEPNTDSTF
jgi:2-hydroxychromene-2-carboxylate isomerase